MKVLLIKLKPEAYFHENLPNSNQIAGMLIWAYRFYSGSDKHTGDFVDLFMQNRISVSSIFPCRIIENSNENKKYSRSVYLIPKPMIFNMLVDPRLKISKELKKTRYISHEIFERFIEFVKDNENELEKMSDGESSFSHAFDKLCRDFCVKVLQGARVSGKAIVLNGTPAELGSNIFVRNTSDRLAWRSKKGTLINEEVVFLKGKSALYFLIFVEEDDTYQNSIKPSLLVLKQIGISPKRNIGRGKISLIDVFVLNYSQELKRFFINLSLLFPDSKINLQKSFYDIISYVGKLYYPDLVPKKTSCFVREGGLLRGEYLGTIVGKCIDGTQHKVFTQNPKDIIYLTNSFALAGTLSFNYAQKIDNI